MIKKEVIVLFLMVALLFVVGCSNKDSCDPPMITINDICCTDGDNNSVCDRPEPEGLTDREIVAKTCGDATCNNQTENCTNCWQDCGACKKIVYVYIPRNYTLGELTSDINELHRKDIKFRKDIRALNNVSNLFYFSEPETRYFADFMDVHYKVVYDSRKVLLSNIFNEEYYVNGSGSLQRYVNYTNWYITYALRNGETEMYEKRIGSGKALRDYPGQPTGYEKDNRYIDWEFRNYTLDEDIIYDSVNVLDDGTVEAIYASITKYDIVYKDSEYYDIDYDTDEETKIEGSRKIEETRMTLIHSLSFTCSRNLVITLYNYDFTTDNYQRISRDNIETQVTRSREKLISQARPLKLNCEKRYSKEIFTYT